MATVTAGESGAAPTLQLVHGHPVVASFFHAISAGAAQSCGVDEENDEEEAVDGGDTKAKRSRSVGDDGGTDATSEDAEGGLNSPASACDAAKSAKKKRKRSRNQKPSYVLRREEKEALEREVHELEARAKQLRDAMGLTGVSDALDTFEVLSEAARRAREQLGAARSLLSELSRRTDVCPLHSFLHLPRDWANRRALMLSMRSRKLQEARQFLTARTRHLSINDASVSSFTDQSTWTTSGGDVCGVRLEVTPFRGVGRPQRVVDALLFYFIHLEISLSEQTGNTAVREDDEGSAQDPGVLHHRLQISMPSGEIVEKSSVLFIDRPEIKPEQPGPTRELLFVAGDFVDQDDRFPYSPQERVRKDISSLIQLAVVPPVGGEFGKQSEESVVMTKWQFLKLHTSREFRGDGRRPLGTDQLERLHANHMRGLDSLVATMRQFLYGAS